MGAETKISWTDHTFNPWWGCVRVSPGCEHCYAETFSKRVGHSIWGVDATRRFFSQKHWDEPRKWNAAAEKAGKPARVFCASMADVFEDRRDLDAERHKLWMLIHVTPWLDWQLLTKRPQNVDAMLPAGIRERVWLGTTAEDQRRLDERCETLTSVQGCRVHFLSCEPLLSALRLTTKQLIGLDWIIAGAESGHGARRMDEDWVRSLRDQAQTAGVWFFYKQRIENGRKVELPVLDGRQWAEFPTVGHETLRQ